MLNNVTFKDFTIKIRNTGSLSLRYQFNIISPTGGGSYIGYSAGLFPETRNGTLAPGQEAEVPYQATCSGSAQTHTWRVIMRNLDNGVDQEVREFKVVCTTSPQLGGFSPVPVVVTRRKSELPFYTLSFTNITEHNVRYTVFGATFYHANGTKSWIGTVSSPGMFDPPQGDLAPGQTARVGLFGDCSKYGTFTGEIEVAAFHIYKTPATLVCTE